MTPVGVRDGDTDALAGLCDRRGPAVLAYCAVIAGQDQAAAAAAEAFGTFRAGVVATEDLANLNPEALLISATRHTAARYAGSDAPPQCARVPPLLAARADRSITLADHDWLQEHLPSCWTCRAPVARFEAADRAYRDPPSTALAPETTAAIVAAMTAAAPVAGAQPPPPPPLPQDMPPAPTVGVGELPSDNGAEARIPGELAPGHVEQPTAAWQLGDDDIDVETGPPVPDAPAPATRRSRERAPRSRPKLAALSRKLRPAGNAASSAHPAAAAEPRTSRHTRRPRSERAGQAARSRRSTPGSPSSRSARSSLRPGLVLPVVLVLVAIVVALLIAGVFGGREAASTPQSFAPDPTTPGETSTTPVVVVPGVGSVTAAEIEREKAKRRAAKRAAKSSTSTTADRSDPTPAAVQPAPAATPATPAAKPKTSTGKDSSKATPDSNPPTKTPKSGGADKAPAEPADATSKQETASDLLPAEPPPVVPPN